MAYGIREWDGTVSAPAVAGAGEMSWESVSGMSPEDPIVGGPHVGGLGAFDVDRGRSRIATMAQPNEPWTGAAAGTQAGSRMEDWRDIFNLHGSPMPWLLILALLALGFIQLGVAGRVGPIRASASAG